MLAGRACGEQAAERRPERRCHGSISVEWARRWFIPRRKNVGNRPGSRSLSTSMHDEGFTNLVETYYAALYRFALSLAKNSADASDLTQQTFFIWATKGQALRDAAKAKTWLFTTLYREFLRVRRRGGRISAIEDLAPAEQDPPDIEVDVVGRLDAQLVMEALQEVELVFREPLTLFYLQDLSYT